MKTDKIIWGLVLVFVGGILLLENFDVINFQWIVVWRFWPLILILIGANMLFSRGDSKTGELVSVFLTIAALGFIGWQGATRESDDQAQWFFHNDRDKGRTSRESKYQVYSEPYAAGAGIATLNVSGGATAYELRDTTSDLFSARVNSSIGSYSLKKTSRDSSETLDFKMTEGSWTLGEDTPNRAIISLNTRPVWDINVETGAGKANFDFTAFKIKKLTFKGGATKLDMKLGEPSAETYVKIETGVSKIHIAIPSGAACRINTDSGLSSNKFAGFEKQSDGSYITSNFNSASRKIIIDFEGGLSKFVVERY
ncbi:LiaI-LiaF-like domain-containing protein [Pararcticibacter amylolyticus]|uniref:LiaI-LiaF-like transmembrane region domain-containing protein n=1 Tax=Pararcticibacter amylolyticus TaxID=2173175 RepID=A0A2U2P9R8_9SPHI|nr:DUF5668 domain-containing protein [Pararcticibacter amylolyticus]PWG78127.1 hypothetical protein DDR33_23965 [Pararcticibacter amylolyticus]